MRPLQDAPAGRRGWWWIPITPRRHIAWLLCPGPRAAVPNVRPPEPGEEETYQLTEGATAAYRQEAEAAAAAVSAMTGTRAKQNGRCAVPTPTRQSRHPSPDKFQPQAPLFISVLLVKTTLQPILIKTSDMFQILGPRNDDFLCKSFSKCTSPPHTMYLYVFYVLRDMYITKWN